MALPAILSLVACTVHAPTSDPAAGGTDTGLDTAAPTASPWTPGEPGRAGGIDPALAPVARPNILVVVLDDFGLDGFACAGLAGVSTAPQPVIQGLCDNGVVFDRVWANPVCSATRASLLTGRYANRHGVGATAGWDGVGLSLDELTLPEVLGEVGYRTGAFGKWHLGQEGSEDYVLHPNLSGFDHYAGALAGSLVDYSSYTRVVDGVSGLSSRYATTETVDDALAWVGAEPGPWFMYVAFNAPHRPLHLPPAELHGYDLDDDPHAIERDPLPYYEAMIEATDTELGRLLDGLPQGDRENTWVLLVGDNGAWSAVNQGVYAVGHEKGTLYEGGVRVPLVVAGPDVANRGRHEGGPVSVVDVFTTVMDLARIPTVGHLPPGLEVDGVSLLPHLLSAQVRPARATMISELFGGGAAREQMGRAATDGQHKYIRWIGGAEALYALDTDPDEQRNLLLDARWSHGTAHAYVELREVFGALPLDRTGGRPTTYEED